MSPFIQVAWPTGTGLAVESTSAGSEDAVTSSHTVTLPSGFQANDVVIVWFRMGASTDNLMGANPSGWTTLETSDSVGPFWLGYRVMNGTEDPTITVTSTADSRSTWVAYRIGGAAVGEGTFLASTHTAATDLIDLTAPSLTPAWGSAANLWLSLITARSSDWTVNSAPQHWSGPLTAFNLANSSVTRSGVAGVRRTHEATSLTAPEWDLTPGELTNRWRWAFVAVRPA